MPHSELVGEPLRAAVANGDVDIELLRSLGYEKFKIISQATMSQPLAIAHSASYAMPTGAKRLASPVVSSA